MEYKFKASDNEKKRLNLKLQSTGMLFSKIAQTTLKQV